MKLANIRQSTTTHHQHLSRQRNNTSSLRRPQQVPYRHHTNHPRRPHHLFRQHHNHRHIKAHVLAIQRQHRRLLPTIQIPTLPPIISNNTRKLSLTYSPRMLPTSTLTSSTHLPTTHNNHPNNRTQRQNTSRTLTLTPSPSPSLLTTATRRQISASLIANRKIRLLPHPTTINLISKWTVPKQHQYRHPPPIITRQ